MWYIFLLGYKNKQIVFKIFLNLYHYANAPEDKIQTILQEQPLAL